MRRDALPHDEGCITLPALRQSGIEMALATIFTEPGAAGRSHGYQDSDDVDGAEAAGLRQLDVYHQLEAAGELTIVRDASDLDRPAPLPKIVILMEGADPIRSPGAVMQWRNGGVRIVGLTWAAGTRYAGGNSAGGPLTSAGVELVAALDEAGVAHDVSHLSDAAFEGLLERARGRIIASHSNCRALLTPRQRHLHDDQIAAVAHRGGVIGLNLYSRFLADGRRAAIGDCIAHLNHMAKVIGHRRSTGLGSDMDGGFGPADLPMDLDEPRKLDALAEALRLNGWSETEVDGFAFGNWMRFLHEALPKRKATV